MAQPVVMRRLLLALALAGCGSSSQGDRLIGDWLYLNADGTAGLGLTFRSDGTYTAAAIQATSATTDNAQIENGTYAATDAAVTFTPTAWSCTGPDPVATDAYSISGNILAVTIPSGLVSFQRISPAPGAVIITSGCFASDASFTPQPLAPVGP